MTTYYVIHYAFDNTLADKVTATFHEILVIKARTKDAFYKEFINLKLIYFSILEP
jgi:hypothetical protein